MSGRGAGECGSGSRSDGCGADACASEYCNGYRMMFSREWMRDGLAGNSAGLLQGRTMRGSVKSGGVAFGWWAVWSAGLIATLRRRMWIDELSDRYAHDRGQLPAGMPVRWSRRLIAWRACCRRTDPAVRSNGRLAHNVISHVQRGHWSTAERGWP